VREFPAFVAGDEIETGKVSPMAASPNGRFLTFLRPTSVAYGELILYDIEQDRETVISAEIELTLDAPLVKWAPSSNFLVYGKGDGLYYFAIEQFLEDRQLAEQFRRLGFGGLESISWRDTDTLYFVSGSLVYEVLALELFTRSLYQDLLRTGRVVGKIPFAFDPNFDSFWISPDGEKILLDKGGRNLFLYFLQEDDFLSVGDTISLPYLFLPRNTRVTEVLWSERDVITLLAGSIERGESQTNLYRLDLGESDDGFAFGRTDDEQVVGMAMSPDGSRAIVLTPDAVLVRDYASWSTVARFEHPEPLHAVWMNNNEAVVAGRFHIERIGIEGEQSDFVAFSQAESYGFAEDGGSVLLRSRGLSARYSADGSGFQPLEDFSVGEASVASDDFRVYLESQTSGSYRNIVMVRNVAGLGTTPLFERPERMFEPFPEEDEPVDLVNFSHGSRIRRREVSLVFNAVDSVEGLTEILNTLAAYEVRATFFVNGEFIRRHPGAVREIADSGHEVGSLFYTYFDMTDSRFQITEEFIKQGLARNEDEYFETTGRELSLLWHAPFYFVSPVLIEASQEMNYTYVGRDVDALDWVPRRDDTGISRLYFPSAELVERAIEQKQPGSIVAMTVGKPRDERGQAFRDDYLFQKLDLLLNNLIERGYSAVPVSTLIDRVQ
jgi:peptidoglycan/xylan/chitin deacetylase (PgdA/CDA1 family)